MNLSSILSYCAASSAVILGAVIIFRDHRSLVHRIFAVGMGVLATEAVLAGLGFQSPSPYEVMSWHRLRMIPNSFLPGIWLLFSLVFARSNYREFLSRWKWIVVASFLLPLLVFSFFEETIFEGGPALDESRRLFFRLGWSGYFLLLKGGVKGRQVAE
jgi:hypothetical protein